MRFRFKSLCLAALMLPTASSAARQTPSEERVLRIQPALTDEFDRRPNIVQRKLVKRPRVALVLSGGGARGIAAIGVFKSFEKNNIPVDFVVGTSMGSILGGLYASGYSPLQLSDLVDSTNWEEVLSFTEDSRRSEMFLDQKIAKERSVLVLRFDGFEPIIPSAFSTGQRLTNYLNLLTLQSVYHPSPGFDDLEISFRAVTTDLISGKRIIIDRGDLTDALRASIAVPLLFSPVPIDTTEQMDGGLVSNIPVDVARQWGADIVVAVDVTSPLRPKDKLNAPWEYADQIMGIMMQEANKRALEQADVVIKPDIGGHLSSDFTGLQYLIKIGEACSDSVVPVVKTMISSRLSVFQGNRNIEFKNPKLVDASAVPPQLRGVVSGDHVSELELKKSMVQLYQSGDYDSLEVVVEQNEVSSTLQLITVLYPVLDAVEFKGNGSIASDTLMIPFRPLMGRRINAHRTGEALKEIISNYRRQGYPLARIQKADLDRSTGRVTVEIEEGVVYRMDIVGTKKTKDYVIWREVPLDNGDILQVSKVAEGIRNLYGTGLFEQVSMAIRKEGDNNILVIKARERSTDLIRLGLVIDSERNAQPSIDVRNENLFGIGAELGLRFHGGSRNHSLLGEFKAIRIFDTYLTANVKGYSTVRDVNVFEFEQQTVSDPLHWDRVRVGEYREVKEGASLSFGTQLERLGSVTVEGRIENHRLYNVFEQRISNQSYKISSVRFGTRLDSQNRFPYPSDGILVNFSYETALVNVGNAVGFTKMQFEYSKYQQLFPRHVIRPRFVLGVADETLPLSEHFSMGGQHSFFGIREDNARGRQLIVGSLEYVYESPFKLFFDTYLKARYDLGAIWSAPEQIRIVDFMHGLGVGIAFDTPIGPAEFSLGRAFFFRKDILDNPLSLGPFIAYFSIGYSL